MRTPVSNVFVPTVLKINTLSRKTSLLLKRIINTVPLSTFNSLSSYQPRHCWNTNLRHPKKSSSSKFPPKRLSNILNPLFREHKFPSKRFLPQRNEKRLRPIPNFRSATLLTLTSLSFPFAPVPILLLSASGNASWLRIPLKNQHPSQSTASTLDTYCTKQ